MKKGEKKKAAHAKNQVVVYKLPIHYASALLLRAMCMFSNEDKNGTDAVVVQLLFGYTALRTTGFSYIKRRLHHQWHLGHKVVHMHSPSKKPSCLWCIKLAKVIEVQ